MLMFIVFQKSHGENREVGRFSDVELDNMKDFDKRQYDVIPLHIWNRTNEGVPLAVIKCITRDKKTSYKEQLFPIFSQQELSDVYISKSGHLMKKSALTEEDQVRIEAFREAQEIFEL